MSMKVYKQKLLFIPNNFEYNKIPDIHIFIDMYYDIFDSVILVKNLDDRIKENSKYTLVEANSAHANYLKYISDYVIDAGELKYNFKLSDYHKWIAIGSSVPYPIPSIQFDPKSFRARIRYSDSYDIMLSKSEEITHYNIRNNLFYTGNTYEVGSVIENRIDYNIKVESQNIRKINHISEDATILLYIPSNRAIDNETIIEHYINKLNKTISLTVIVKLENEYSLINTNTKNISKFHYSEDLVCAANIIMSDDIANLIAYKNINIPKILYIKNDIDYDLLNDYKNMFNIDFLDRIVYYEKDLSDLNFKTLIAQKTISKNEISYNDTFKLIKKHLNLYNIERYTKEIIILIEGYSILMKNGFLESIINFYISTFNAKIIVVSKDVINMPSFKYDILISNSLYEKACKSLLKNTDGYILSLDESTHEFYQNQLEGKNNILFKYNYLCKDKLEIYKRLINYKYIINLVDFKGNESILISDNNESSETILSYDFHKNGDNLVLFNKIHEINVSVEQKASLKVINKVKNKKTLKKDFKTFLINNLPSLELWIRENKLINKLKKNNFYPKVSIIIPCYNARDTIKTTILSVLKQGYKNIEIIVVEDGDYNTSEKIIESIKSDKIRYYKKENSGPGLTRNYGMDKSKGEFIFFLDSDDEMYVTTLTNMLEFAYKNDVDIVSGITVRKNTSDGTENKWQENKYKKNHIDNIRSRDILYDDVLSTNKLYKKSVLIENNIYFSEGLYEDKIFTAKLYTKVDNIGIINKEVYIWNYSEFGSSISTSRTIDNLKERINSVEITFGIIPDHIKNRKFAFFLNHDILIYIREFNRYNDNEKLELFKYTRKFTINYMMHYNENYILDPFKKRYIAYIFCNDFDSFCLISTLISNQYYSK